MAWKMEKYDEHCSVDIKKPSPESVIRYNNKCMKLVVKKTNGFKAILTGQRNCCQKRRYNRLESSAWSLAGHMGCRDQPCFFPAVSASVKVQA